MVFLVLRLSDNTEKALRGLCDRITAETVNKFGARSGSSAFWGQQSLADQFPIEEPYVANFT